MFGDRGQWLGCVRPGEAVAYEQVFERRSDVDAVGDPPGKRKGNVTIDG
jgi:hypothetical protein